MITIYHNPRCSKSREAFAIVEEFAARKSLAVEVVEYLSSPPSLAQLAQLQSMLSCPAAEMVRNNEEEYAGLGLDNAPDADLLRALAAHPNLLQRPIVAYGGKAVIGRPPELVRALLKD